MADLLAYGAIFVSSFVLALSGAIAPGPLITATITESLRRGSLAGPLLITGHGLLELVLLGALLLGLTPLFHEPWFVATVSLSGGTILLGMAWSIRRALPTLKLALPGTPAASAGRSLILKGAVLSLANPYFTIWWATIGLGYIMHSLRLGPAAVAAFFTGHILGDLFWYGLVSFTLARGRKLLTDRLYRGIMAAGAAILALFACYFVYLGLDMLWAWK